ncbi:MAG: hypothetical protein VX757_06630, partial [Planctomycetota bacterium]|nr:hypothetical protein [Planctomycetota bacterium]
MALGTINQSIDGTRTIQQAVVAVAMQVSEWTVSHSRFVLLLRVSVFAGSLFSRTFEGFTPAAWLAKPEHTRQGSRDGTRSRSRDPVALGLPREVQNMSGLRCFTERESDPETMRKCESSGRFNLPMVMSTAGRGCRG